MLPLLEGLLLLVGTIWNAPSAFQPTSKKTNRLYQFPHKGLTYHPSTSLVEGAAVHMSKDRQVHSTPSGKEGKRLDVFVRKIFSSATLLST